MIYMYFIISFNLKKIIENNDDNKSFILYYLQWYMYDKGVDKCLYFKYNEDMVVCILQFIAQYLISYKVELVIEKNGCFFYYQVIKN